MYIKKLLLLAITIALLSSCASSKKVRYFQDLQTDSVTIERIATSLPIKLAPDDKISIRVKSKDTELASTFNIRLNNNSENNLNMIGYTVDEQGKINFPVLGHIHVEGMSKKEVATYIESELIKRNLLKDPIVIVEYMNLVVAVLGEVSKPGRISIERDNMTLLEALSMAGDLTIQGKRENVLVMREENGKPTPYYVDLCSATAIYSSPAYYLQQNDVIYVEPTDTRARQSSVNGNTLYTPSFWMSLASFLMSLTVFFFR